jgi:ubiquinone biosynthesis protein COQ4
MFRTIKALSYISLKQNVVCRCSCSYSTSHYKGHIEATPLQKVVLGVGSAIASFLNPERGDMVATLGDVTSPFATKAMLARMLAHPAGRDILSRKPILRYSSTGQDGVNLQWLRSLPESSFGGSYVRWMDRHGFDPNERPLVK